MPPVASDNDLHKLLNTPTKQVKRIKTLVSEHLGSVSKRVDRPPMQGLFSRTFFVTLADGREVVIQFRTEKLDLDAFKVARGALGSIVPDAVALKDGELEHEGVWAYSLERLPGKMWVHGVAGKGAEGRIAVNRSLGRVLSKGCLADNSGETVSTKIRPHLEAILASPLEEVATYRPLLQGFLDKLNEISKPPPWVSHYDLNDVNVLVDESCQVTGLIDWELSTPEPFAKTRGMLEKNISLIQDAVILGTLLDTFFCEDGKVRGDEPPYKE
ncbi:Aminoglycoside phosphotransferase domain-containing protein [Madurella fahalii]|uniref:Aminoglycoside phosphotransferase domain-containing protein n=1 Tax=Madurella fahalii TaxID=1157608 RepID=A0ABQ0GLI3_9PEZI